MDPTIETAFRRLMDASDKLASVRIRSEHERVGDWDTRRVVDDALMQRLAESNDASPELARYGRLVAAGHREWRDVDRLAVPIPPEVAQLKESSLFRWFPDRPNKRIDEFDPEYTTPYRIPWE